MRRLIVVLVLVIMLCACGGEPTPAPTSDLVATQIAVERAAHATMTAEAPTATDTQEPTQPPTDTAVPTNTPRPTSTATRTPVPTDTRTPRPTPPPTFSAAEDYALDIQARVSLMATALGNIGELMGDAGAGSDEWIGALVIEIVMIQLQYEAIVEMDAPPEMESIHDLVVSGSSDCNDSMDYLADGIDNLDSSLIDASTTAMESCAEQLVTVVEMLNEFLSTGEVPTLEPTDIPVPTNTPKPTAKPQPKPTKAPTAAPQLAQMGEQVKAGNWLFTVTEVQWHKALYLYDDSRVAMGVYCVIFADVQNQASGTTFFGKLWWDLRGAQGVVFDDDGATYRASWQFGGRDTHYTDLNPGQTAQIVMAFDVGQESKGLQLYSYKIKKPFVLIGDAQPPQDQ